jgi:glycosyltransferase involved in cell wall biosynthesis
LIHLADFDRPHGGSFIAMVVGVLATARKRGWETEVVLFEGAAACPWVEDFRGAGVTVHLAPESVRRSFGARRNWLGPILARDREPTVLHTHFTTWDVPVALASRRHPAAHVFWHVHSALSRQPLILARSALKLGALRHRIDAILCPAPNIAAGVRRRLGPRAKVHFLPSAIDTGRFPLLDSAARAAARRDLDLPLDATVLLHFGWHFRLKGNDIFLRTVRRLVDDGLDDVIALSRGGGEETARLASELGLADRLRLVEPVRDITTLHGAASALVASSREEGMAYAVLEALCCGTPVVATDIPGHAFLAREIEHCRVATRDPVELAGAIRDTVSRDGELAAREAASGRDWIDANLSVGAIAERLVAMYEKSAGGEGHGSPPAAVRGRS